MCVRAPHALFESRHIPRVLSETGKIHMSRKAINQKIGQLFIMRINVNLVSNVLGTCGCLALALTFACTCVCV